MSVIRPIVRSVVRGGVRGVQSPHSNVPAIVNDFAYRMAFKSAVDFERDSEVNGFVEGPVLNTFATDAPAFVIDPATGQALGYRALAGFTNSLLWSRDLSNAVWAGADVSLAQDATGLKGVANTAWTVTDNDSGTLAFRQQSVSVADDSNTHTVSWYVKKDSDTSRFPELWCRLRNGTTEVTQGTQINTSDGSKNERVSDGSATVEDAGDFWRVTNTVTNNGTGNTELAYRIYPAITTTFGSAESSATGSIVYDFGGVYLNSSIAGPPIETEGSPVSTAADDASEPLPESCQDGFVWVGAINTGPAMASGERRVITTINDGGNDEQIQIRRSGAATDIEMVARVGGSAEVILTAADPGDNQNTKVAIRAENGRWALVVGGGSVQKSANATFPAGLSNKFIGQNGATLDHWNSTIARDELYDNPADWTDADLQAATS